MVLQRRRGGNLGLLLLGSQVLNFGLQNIPPVTLGLLTGQVAIHLNFFPKLFRSANTVCMSTYLVLVHKEWRRLLLANFFHADDMHLYFNMVSLLYKGTMLEKKFGNVYFAYLVGVFTALTSFTYVGLGFILDTVLSDQKYFLSCSVGFSGVLFAMKVLTTHYSPRGTQYVLGMIPVPSKYVFWVELILIQMITPNASFVGHLAGILVGLMYTKGPLKYFLDSFIEPGRVIDFSQPNTSGTRNQSSFFGSRLFGRGNNFDADRGNNRTSNLGGAQGGGPSFRPGQFHGNGRAVPSAPPSNPYDDQNPQPPRVFDGQEYNAYTGGLSEEQQYQQAMEESMRQGNGQPPPPDGLYPDLNRLRSRRTQFYQ